MVALLEARLSVAEKAQWEQRKAEIAEEQAEEQAGIDMGPWDDY